jgi:hypothetical protein
MFNKTKPGALEALQKQLKVPAKPAAISEAEMRWREAIVARQDMQERHRAASAQYHSQKPGQAITICLSEVDEVGRLIAPLEEAERIAAAAREVAVNEYQQAIGDALAVPIAELHHLILTKTSELEELLAIGSALHIDASAARVVLPSRLPGACASLVEAGLRYFRAGLNRIPQPN